MHSGAMSPAQQYQTSPTQLLYQTPSGSVNNCSASVSSYNSYSKGPTTNYSSGYHPDGPHLHAPTARLPLSPWQSSAYSPHDNQVLCPIDIDSVSLCYSPRFPVHLLTAQEGTTIPPPLLPSAPCPWSVQGSQHHYQS